MYFFSVEDTSRGTQGTRAHCKKCLKETMFVRRKCVECGTMFIKKFAARKGGGAWTFSEEMSRRNRVVALRNDKREYYARLAEESRKKFEGGK